MRKTDGYAGMPEGEISRSLLAAGALPMLFANAEYPSSNRAYQKIGYENQGGITEYQFV